MTGPVLFVTHGSRSVGLGHVRRCLSLAAALKKRSVECEFLLDADQGVAGIVTGSGFVCTTTKNVSSDPDEAVRRIRELAPAAVVADSYTFTTDYFRRLSGAGRPVVAIDDLENRSLPVALVVNSRVGVGPGDYVRHVALETRLLLGPAYALLRPEFAQAPNRVVGTRISRVLLTLGGGDPANLMPRLVRWVATELEWANLAIVAGPLFDNRDEIRAEAAAIGRRAAVHEQPGDMRALMLEADIAVSSGGQTLFELAATATPTVAVRLADNQTRSLGDFQRSRTLRWAGDARDSDVEARVRHALRLAGDTQTRRQMAEAGRKLVDGQGAARVADVIVGIVARDGIKHAATDIQCAVGARRERTT